MLNLPSSICTNFNVFQWTREQKIERLLYFKNLSHLVKAALAGLSSLQDHPQPVEGRELQGQEGNFIIKEINNLFRLAVSGPGGSDLVASLKRQLNQFKADLHAAKQQLFATEIQRWGTLFQGQSNHPLVPKSVLCAQETILQILPQKHVQVWGEKIDFMSDLLDLSRRKESLLTALDSHSRPVLLIKAQEKREVSATPLPPRLITLQIRLEWQIGENGELKKLWWRVLGQGEGYFSGQTYRGVLTTDELATQLKRFFEQGLTFNFQTIHTHLTFQDPV